MGLLSALGINLPGPLGGNPFSSLIGEGGMPTPPTVIGQGFHNLLPALAQAFQGKLGDPTAASPVPQVGASGPSATSREPIGFQAQGQATPRNIGGYNGTPAVAPTTPQDTTSVHPPAMFIPPPAQPAPQPRQTYTPPAGLPAPNIKLQNGATDPGMLYAGLKQRGFNDAQAAALLGNWKQESEFKTSAYNPGEAATGMMQWREARRTGLVNYAKATGRSPTDPNVQMDYTARETGLVPDETHTVRVDPGGPAFVKASDLTQANAALKQYIRYGSPYNQGGEGTRLSNAAYYYNQYAGGRAPSVSPTFDAMSRPSGQGASLPMGMMPNGGIPGTSTGGPDLYGAGAGGDFNTKLAVDASGKPRQHRGGGGAGGPSDPGSSGGGGAHRNSVSADYKRYQARQSTDYLRSLSPVATLQSLENIGKAIHAGKTGAA